MNDHSLPEVLFSEQQIRDRVAELANAISADYADGEEVLMIGVLRGAFIFLADLSRRLTVERQIDFIALSSYEDGAQHRGAVRLIMDLRSDVAGKHVLIVDDIADTGRTLEYLKRNLATRRAASVRTCVLLRKPSRHEVPVQIDYVGFEIPDAWVVGYGLDYTDRFRSLPYIGIVDSRVD